MIKLCIEGNLGLNFLNVRLSVQELTRNITDIKFGERIKDEDNKTSMESQDQERGKCHHSGHFLRYNEPVG